MSREELAEFTRRLSMLSADGVEGIYRTAHNDCRLDDKRVPPAAAVQQLVAAWRVLRKILRIIRHEAVDLPNALTFVLVSGC